MSNPEAGVPCDFPVPARYRGIALPGVGGVDLWCAEDAAELLDMVRYREEFKQKNELMPYWGEIWTSAYLLALVFALGRIPLRGDEKVVEIGAGTGLPGVVLAKLGCSVTLTDVAEDALRILQIHCRENGLDATERCTVRELDIFHPHETRDIARSYDLLIGADVLFEKRMGAAVSRTLEHLLSAEGEAIIADPCRETASSFFEVLERDGWRYTEVRYPCEDLEALGISDPKAPCRLIRVRRRWAETAF